FSDSADTIKKYVSELKKLLKDQQDEARERNRQIEEGVFDATADPEKTSVPPPREAIAPFINFAPLENGLEALTRSADRYQRALGKFRQSQDTAPSEALLKSVNEKLLQSERVFTTAEGLPERPWFKHQIYAPGAYTGYGVKTIPAVRESI